MKMRTEKRELDKIYKRRNRYEIPDYQRQQVWDDDKKQMLIDSILRGWKIPKFYFVQNSDDASSYDVVDGQQRLAAIFEFLDGDLRLSDKSAAEFGGQTYDTLPVDVSDQVDDFEIDYDEISDATEEDLADFFQRLQSGMQLNSTEKLNAIAGKFKTFIKSLSVHSFFANKVSFTDKRFAHFDVSSKAAAIEVEGIEANLRFDEMKSLFESQKTFSDKSAVAARLVSALDFLDRATPAGSKTFKNRTITQSFFNLVAALGSDTTLKGKEKIIGDFAKSFVESLAKEVEKGHQATDLDLIGFQRSINANVRSGAQVRHRALMRKLFEWDPSILDAAGLHALSVAGYDGELISTSKRISQLIHDINNVNAAVAGKDLIKPTNKTVKAVSDMGSPVKNKSDFKDLVDGLYFTFWEGLPSDFVKPSSFLDVRTLRTEFDHDVDHGGAKKFMEKKQSAATVFERLAGVSSPEVAGPERFVLAQLKLLRTIEKDLQKIAADQAPAKP